MNLPAKYIEYMKRLLKDDYPLYEDSLLKPRFFGLRVNTLKIKPEDFLNIFPFKLRPVPWTSNGFYYEEDKRPALHPYYYGGLYYIQEPSAMTPACILPIEPGDTVLDLCAAPGGKSTEIASRLKGEGLLVSNDISASRAKALLKNLETFGIKNSIIISEDPAGLSRISDLCFDKILIDAPCSGEGMFRKDSKLISAWTRNGPDYFSEIQRKITTNIIPLLKPGGMLLYSTCTFNKKENEDIIINLLKKSDELELVDIPKEHGFRPGYTDTDEEKKYHLDRAIRLFPFALDGEGHFVALIKKKGNESESVSGTSKEAVLGKDKSKKIKNEFFEFSSRLSVRKGFDKTRLVQRDGRIFYTPDSYITKKISDKGFRILRCGLFMGEEKKNRFEPSQALAMALCSDEYDNIINLSSDDIRVDKYLKGETISFENNETDAEDGYVLFCTDGFPLGWGKKNGNTMKNKYLPGWRKQS